MLEKPNPRLSNNPQPDNIELFVGYGFKVIGYFKEREEIQFPDEMDWCSGPKTLDFVYQKDFPSSFFGLGGNLAVHVLAKTEKNYILGMPDQRGTIFMADRVFVESLGFNSDNFDWEKDHFSEVIANFKWKR